MLEVWENKLKIMYSKKEVVELLETFAKGVDKGIAFREFCKEKGLIKEDFKVGQWWKLKIFDGSTYYMCLSELRNGSWYWYGIFDGKWGNSSASTYDMKKWERMTPQEIEEALIKEAKPKYDSKTAISLDDGHEYEISDCKFYFSIEYNTLGVKFKDGSSCELFTDGMWAEIVEDKKEEGITINGDWHLLDDKFHHIVTAFDGDGYKLYVDGELRASRYNRCLTHAEIKEMYNNGIPKDEIEINGETYIKK